ncbi:MAG: SGNH/GDSL hydrolase family protein [Acidimicrobiia bacterium]
MTRAVRRSALGLPVAATAALTALGAQAWYAGHRSLPRFTDLDIDGVFGGEHAPEVRLAILGDSTVTGTGLDNPADLWVRQAVDRLTDRLRIRVRSHAAGGARARDVLEHQVDAAVVWRPDVAVVSVGANDALRRVRIAGFEAELRAIVESLRRAGATVVLAGVGDVGTAPLLPFPLRLVVSERSRVADRVHARVVAAYDGVLKVPVAETIETFRHRSDLFCDDLFHPNRNGHEVWADVAFPVLERAILQAQTAHAAMAASVWPGKRTSSSAVVSHSSQST